jgi:hypothetical protein
VSVKTMNHDYKNVGLSHFLIALVITGATAHLLQAEVDNAALSYYQALIECPDRRTPEYNENLAYLCRRDNVAKDNTNFRQAVDTYQRVVIPFVEIGIQAEYCDWGVLPQTYHRSYLQSSTYSDSMYDRASFLLAVLGADKDLSMFDGDTKGALQKSLNLFKLCCHLGQHPRITICSLRGAMTFTEMVKNILGSPIEQETLVWLKDQVKAELDEKSRQDRAMWVVHLIREGVTGDLEDLQKDFMQKDFIDDSGLEFDRNGNAVTGTGKIIDVNDILASIQSQVEMHMDRVYPVLKGMKAPYQLTLSELSDLIKPMQIYPLVKVGVDDSNAPWSIDIQEIISPAPSHHFLNFETRMSALQVAIEIYLIKSKTGHLPESIPASAPKTPYNDEPFEYKLIDDGFSLRYCREWDGTRYWPPGHSELDFKLSSSSASEKTDLSTKEEAIDSNEKQRE